MKAGIEKQIRFTPRRMNLKWRLEVGDVSHPIPRRVNQLMRRMTEVKVVH